MMPLRYHRASDVDDAVATMTAEPNAAFLAGGTNLVDHLGLGITAPDLLVDVTRLPLGEIDRTGDGGLRIGAMARGADVAAYEDVRREYPMLARALLSAASPQLRNLATTGGNLMQRTRCGYFQDSSTPCNKREPGTGCSALGGFTRYHAILGASRHCIATNPSDMAVALAALDAVVIVVGPDGQRTIPVVDFHRLPGDEPAVDTVLGRDELIVAVELPPPVPGAVGTYRKVRDRASYAFAIVSVAAEVATAGGRVTSARIALGGVAHKPWRARAAEEFLLAGDDSGDDLLRGAAAAELAAAHPVPGNEFKVDLAARTLRATLREVLAS
ncbi:xanthine dehydrogenase family protein subunit M [Rhodococcus rhodnii]|uniref:Xanthine dehydrogenase FAD-binding subunit n=2 Tax=Rhodococcus rhodnii TaxID=38312 RepID=R7WKX5_9NOCA|nr:xanthine dehydrogenase family protein subunit M [Rhodococcus rhodnii]EOM75935.1 xanthine dehydrogenase FAD-binding subunit [Rhodococcus rhodnii LMG 5362]TXG90147.1 xanthine dehydrogenase family protein subunit M [Rhodococcus rhodnii]